METFKDFVKSNREGRDLSQDELADYLGVDKRTIQYWESGASEPRPKKREEVEQFFRDFDNPEKLLINTEDFTETSLVANTKLLRAIFAELIHVRAFLEGKDYDALYRSQKNKYFGPQRGQ